MSIAPPLRPAAAASVAQAQASQNHSRPSREGRPLEQLDGPAGVGVAPGDVSGVELQPGHRLQGVGQAGTVGRRLRLGRGQRLGQGDGPDVAVAGLGGPAQVAEGVTGGGQRGGQVIAIVGDIRAGLGESLGARSGPAPARPRASAGLPAG